MKCDFCTDGVNQCNKEAKYELFVNGHARYICEEHILERLSKLKLNDNVYITRIK